MYHSLFFPFRRCYSLIILSFFVFAELSVTADYKPHPFSGHTLLLGKCSSESPECNFWNTLFLLFLPGCQTYAKYSLRLELLKLSILLEKFTFSLDKLIVILAEKNANNMYESCFIESYFPTINLHNQYY